MVTAELKLFRFLSIMLMVTTFLPILSFNLPSILRSHHLWTSLWLLSLLLFRPGIFSTKIIKMLLLYGLVFILISLNLVWFDLDPWNKNTVVVEYYEIFIAMSVYLYFEIVGDHEGFTHLIKYTFFFILITASISIYVSVLNPSYARELTGLSQASLEIDKEAILRYQKLGAGGYDFYIALLPLIAVLIMFAKKDFNIIIGRKGIILTIGILIYCVIVGEFFANILVLVIVVFFGVAGTKNKNWLIILSGILFVGYYIIPLDFFIHILYYISNLFDPQSETHFKIIDFALFLSYDSYTGTGAGGRAERFPLLLDSFLSNPLIGGEFSNGHLYWMNKLAVFGLLGTVPFVYILYKYLKTIKSSLNIEFSFYFQVAIISIVLLGMIKSIAGRSMWYMLFCIIPGVLFLAKAQETNKNKNIIKV